MVYARKTGKHTVTLQVSGMLWQRSLVMRDVETGSLWSHILGECMSGKLRGSTLKILPSVMTTWGDWKAHHPLTTVLNMSRTARRFRPEFYKNPERFVYGVVIGGKPKAYSLGCLRRIGLLEDRLGDRPVLVVFDAASTAATMFDRRVDGKTLFFKRDKSKVHDEYLTDTRTSSRWDSRTGVAVDGKLKGKRLEMLPGIMSFRRSWKTFHPESEVVEGSLVR